MYVCMYVGVRICKVVRLFSFGFKVQDVGF